MATYLAVLGIVARRSLANWRLLATVVVGTVLSAALMSMVILYSDAVRDLGLQHALESKDPLALDIRVSSSSESFRGDEVQQMKVKTDQILRAYTHGIIDRTVRYGRSATFYLTPPGGVVSEEQSRPRSQFQFQDGLPDHIRVVEGRAPVTATPAGETPPTVEVWVGKATSSRLNVPLNSEFDLHPFWKPAAAPVHVKVVGIIEPKDPNEEFWFNRPDRFEELTPSWPTYPFFVPESTVTSALAAYLPDIDGSIETYAYIDRGRVNSRNARDIEDGMLLVDQQLREQIARTTSESILGKTLAEFRTKLFFTRLPLFALMLQVVGIVLYYLVMVSTMLVERQVGELALLKSRGASALQVLGIYAIEGGILCLAAAILGPLVAAGSISLLGPTPPFHDLSHGELLKVPLTRNAWALAFGGATLALLAMLIPAWRASRQTMVDYKHSLARPPAQPLFLRYYFDLGLVGVGAFAFWELRQRGSLVTEKLFGDLSADPLLLVSPSLFMLMVALVFLRLFPLGLRVVSKLAAPLNGATVALGLSRMVRSPMHYSRLILLVLLATAVGMFASGFRATLEKSYSDRASFKAAAPDRLQGVRTPANLPTAGFVAAIQKATGAGTVVPVSRQEGSYTLSQFKTTNVTVLGVPNASFANIAYWRDDFADESLPTLLKRLPIDSSAATPSVAVPAGTRLIGFWAQNPMPAGLATLGIRLKDEDGVFWEFRAATEVDLQAPGRGQNLVANPPWQFFVADLSRTTTNRFGTGAPYRIDSPKTFDALFVRAIANPPAVPERVTLVIDDVTASPGGAALPAGWGSAGIPGGTVIDNFSDSSRWETIAGVSIVGEPAAVSSAEKFGRDGSDALRVAFTRQRGTPTVLGFRTRSAVTTLPVLTSNSFLSLSKHRQGDSFGLYVNRQYVQVKVVGTFDLFPGHDPSRSDSLMVADLGAMQEIAGRVPNQADGVFANEAWMSATPSTLTKDSLAKPVVAESIFDAAQLRDEQASDPLVAASWEGILFLSFAAVLALTALGFAVYANIAAQTRSLEFAILRTMGYSSRQILMLVSFEQLFVVASGIVVGTLLGFPLGRLMIGYLGVNESGQDPVPPILSQIRWDTVVTVYGLLAVVFVATIVFLAATYSRLAVSRALRIGEM